MNNINNQLCSGCGGCVEICPISCISLTPSSDGFLKAAADEQQCIDCGLCTRKCSMLSAHHTDMVATAWAAYHKNSNIRNISSSGGVFYALAKEIIQRGGIICGAAFNQELNLRHTLVYDLENLPQLCGSKYLQSDVRGVYPKIKEAVQAGKTVLFVGTPCQVAGLYTAIGRRPENLITCDLVCHGVPSPGLFQGYLRHLENKYKSKIVSFRFRSKEKANARMSYTVKLGLKQNNTDIFRYISGDEEPYTMRFISGTLQAESCYQCPFASTARTGDLTFADYWGYETAHPELENILGVSLVLANSEKGRILIEALQEVQLIPTQPEKYLPQNNHLSTPIQKHPERDSLYAAFAKQGFTKQFYHKVFLPKGYKLYILKRRIKALLNGH